MSNPGTRIRYVIVEATTNAENSKKLKIGLKLYG